MKSSGLRIAFIFVFLLASASACSEARSTGQAIPTTSFPLIAPTTALPAAPYPGGTDPPVPILIPSGTPLSKAASEATGAAVPAPTSGLPESAHPVNLEIKAQVGGEPAAMELLHLQEGDRAYLALGPRLVILEISGSPESLRIAQVGQSEILPYTAVSLALAGSYAYWLSPEGLLLALDVSNPASPRLAASLPIPAGNKAIAIRGSLAYLAGGNWPPGGSENALRIYDLSDPLQLVELGQVELPNQSIDLSLDVNWAYVTTYDGRLLVVDVSEPAHPSLVETGIHGRGIGIHPPYAFAATGDLVVYDLHDPARPDIMGAAPLEEDFLLTQISASALTGETLYLIGPGLQPCGSDVSPACLEYLEVIDLSNPAHPQMVLPPDAELSFQLPQKASVEGERLYVLDTEGLAVLDIRNPLQPRLLGRFNTMPLKMEAYDLVARDGYVYVGNDIGDSLYAIDLRDLSQPRLFGPFPQPLATGGALSGETLYLPLNYLGLSVLDVSRPEAPEQVARLEDEIITLGGDLTQSAVVMGNTLYVNQGPYGLAIVDISNPQEPRTIGHLDLGISALESGPEFLYVLTRSSLLVMDTRDPANLQTISSIDLPSANGLAVDGDTAYVTSRQCLNENNTGGLAIINLSDPQRPDLVGVADTPCGMLDAAVFEEDYVALAAGMNGLLLVDVSDPQNPTLAAQIDTPDIAVRVETDGDQIYVLAEESGLLVYGRE